MFYPSIAKIAPNGKLIAPTHYPYLHINSSVLLPDGTVDRSNPENYILYWYKA